MAAHSGQLNRPRSCSASAMAKACASHGARNTGPSSSRGMLCTAAVARIADSRSFRLSERSERVPESIITVLSDEPDRQINPFGIVAFDQADLPFAMPFLQLLCAHDRGFRIVEDFKVHQLVDAVTRGETAHGLQLVLMNAAHETVGHANVQGSVLAAGQDVDEKLPVHSTRSGYGFRA